MLDRFIYDAVVVLLVDLRGIAIKSHRDSPFHAHLLPTVRDF